MEIFQYDPQHRRHVEGWNIICFDGEDKIGLTAREWDGKRKLPFLALYKKRKLIIRADFDKYLEDHPEEKEYLKKCQRTSPKDETQSIVFFEAAKASGPTESTSSSTW